jgi:ribosomal protein S18 acetylase RimI-like enzyme
LTAPELQVRLAAADDAPALEALSAAVQAALTRAGSLQQIGRLPADALARRIQAGQVLVLVRASVIIGSVFIEPLADPQVWKLDELGGRWYFLSRLMIAPEMQGRGLGPQLVRALQVQVAAQPCAGIVLDCWAGNRRLRALYASLGFRLHGIFPEADYAIAVMVWVART